MEIRHPRPILLGKYPKIKKFEFEPEKNHRGQVFEVNLIQKPVPCDFRGKDFFILSGPQYEQGSYVEGYSYYSKFVRNHQFWLVYTMVYPDRYKPALTRLFKEIDNWQVWERPHLKLKQGENQTPKAVSE